MTIIQGDCLEVMRSFPDNHFSAIVTDPPYGLSFMNKGWDHAIPDQTYWRECFRVVIPGSFLIAMGGTRTFHRLACAIEDSGFEIRDCISYLYGSGFPKSHNHFGLNGYGTALKPAWEPCILGMKPCDGTFKQNAEKWGQAGINIDGCRIKTNENLGRLNSSSATWGTYGNGASSQYEKSVENQGRWPANVILDEEAGKMLDEQSGFSKSRPDYRNNEKYNSVYQGGFKRHPNFVNDSGGASRFFYCAKASSSERNEGLEELPLKSTHRLNPGMGGGKDPKAPTFDKNHHPTVKPLKLMEYLIKLVMPPEKGLLLDPFAGSGTTILAAKRLGFDAIGIEREQEYCDIANARLKSA